MPLHPIQTLCPHQPVPALPSEGLIGVIAPAGPAPLDTDKAVQWMRARGHELRIFPGVYEKDGYLAGSDDTRLNDLHGAFADSEVNAIICLRGGYGTPRLLDRIDFELLRCNAKPFVGYSDITALHLAISRYAGFVTFHGPLLNADLLGDKEPSTVTSFFSLLRGQLKVGDVLSHPDAYPLTTVWSGTAHGRLLGGNLSIIAATMGTPYQIDAEDVILFIEDVNEPLYRIDRLLTQLRLAGTLQKLRAVLVGDVAGVDGEALNRLLRQTFEPLRIPVLSGWRSGHCDPNLTLPMGALVSLDAGEKRLVLEQDVVTTR
ncbi:MULTISPECIES: LD-carboxypeptidase [unclassified Pseudomonas]|uniref:S66 peptidase family protein n=1 Tax=unclassified Pseudomonas TaxID=196821 RepID=UPI00119A259E|nr:MULTISPECIES: LD-carboxypeptidase [unclassified Pseudomonas]TWC12878.1 muramoyltetrapeptide carboxypeptidase [Pseudomonas sp. SJZ075]TWC13541.1 muramoyltetrapeptide carboxypeptidase [Pseudomonas sp. SJZ074]TWC29351.1 muramoyltetrapeptide carboxypeptidase [Pseudomonas sp. SJZ078]TWC31949.1 muramoyltetrapeptide carboxypeptidase [Pseudomonas sp. SJZ085]TWC49806.1 muramoyltetrapeptide carboxypeptidase [Pseudomonas sp. SJZ124]